LTIEVIDQNIAIEQILHMNRLFAPVELAL
jgi:hypothetical protein